MSFQPLQNRLPVILIDDEGTEWDVFGKGASGPRSGQQFQSVPAYTAYWFAWAAFYPETEINSFTAPSEVSFPPD